MLRGGIKETVIKKVNTAGVQHIHTHTPFDDGFNDEGTGSLKMTGWDCIPLFHPPPPVLDSLADDCALFYFGSFKNRHSRSCAFIK